MTEQIGMMFAESKWVAPHSSEWPSWKYASRVALDTETCDPDLKTLGPGVRRGAYIVGISVAVDEGPPGVYLPIRHEGGGNLDVEQVMKYIRYEAKNFTGELVGANLLYDLDFLAEVDVKFPRIRKFLDILVAEGLIDEMQYKYSLDNCGVKYCDEHKDESLLNEALATFGKPNKGNLWRLPASMVGPYAEQDVDLPLKVLREQEDLIKNEDLHQVWELESKLIPVLLAIRRLGVPIDLDRLDQIEGEFNEKEHLLYDEIHRITGITLGSHNIWVAGDLAKVFKGEGIDVPLTPKTRKPSIKADWLEEIGSQTPIGKLILRARQFNKAQTTFCHSLRRFETGGRVHCQLHQTRYEKDDGTTAGAGFGRMSSSKPNLQQQPSPKRDPEIGVAIRSCFVPDQGMIWGCQDFSQQEPRLTTHFAEITPPRPGAKPGLLKAYEAGELYRNDPNADSYDIIVKLTGLIRENSKTVFLGVSYGMGTDTLCANLGLSKMEGRKVIREFDKEIPYVRKLANMASTQAQTHGFIRTLLGRRCRFPVLTGTEENGYVYDWTHKALNRLIQGSAGDQTKQAMIDVHNDGHDIYLAVHDELDTPLTNRAHGEKIAEIMADAVKITVPFKVDVETGPNWGEIS